MKPKINITANPIKSIAIPIIIKIKTIKPSCPDVPGNVNSEFEWIQIQINDGIVIIICITSHKRALFATSADALAVDNPHVLSQNIVYGSLTKLAGVTAIKNERVKVYKNIFQNFTFILSFPSLMVSVKTLIKKFHITKVKNKINHSQPKEEINPTAMLRNNKSQ
jgi:hypothetical protein